MTDENEEEIIRNGILDDLKDLGDLRIDGLRELVPEGFKLNRTIPQRNGTYAVVDLFFDPKKHSEWVRYKWTGYVKTPKMEVAYCWTTRRNQAGYFLGWRQIRRKSGLIERDQLVARKSRKRLAALQYKRSHALAAKSRKKGLQ